MKLRQDFVTNSSSSSFIIKNNSDRTMTSEEVILSLLKNVIEDAKDRFVLSPGEELIYECGDHPEDGAFENFIHGMSWSYEEDFGDGKVDITLHESYHY